MTRECNFQAHYEHTFHKQINNLIAMHKCKSCYFPQTFMSSYKWTWMRISLTWYALCWRIQSEFTRKLKIQMHISLVHTGSFNAARTIISRSFHFFSPFILLHNDTWHIQSIFSQYVSNAYCWHGIISMESFVPLESFQWKINNWQMWDAST